MGPYTSDVRCRCGNKTLEWVSFTEKNPGRRFVKCANRVSGCRFWEWIDEPVSPLVRSVMDAKLKKAERKMKIMGLALVVCLVVLVLVLRGGNHDECKCSCNCGLNEIAATQL